jgi:hypothetical protein
VDQHKPIFIDLKPSIHVKVVRVFDEFYGFPDSMLAVVIFFGEDFGVF